MTRQRPGALRELGLYLGAVIVVVLFAAALVYPLWLLATSHRGSFNRGMAALALFGLIALGLRKGLRRASRRRRILRRASVPSSEAAQEAFCPKEGAEPTDPTEDRRA